MKATHTVWSCEVCAGPPRTVNRRGAAHTNGPQRWCSEECRLQARRAKYAAGSTQAKQDLNRYLVVNYGITADEYDAMLQRQGGVCAVCRKPPEVQQRRLSVDHDHKCCPNNFKTCGNCVRALLCTRCNTGLGSFFDDPDLLVAAAAYLMSTRDVLAEVSGD